jgi:hypothetical protein
MTSTGVASDLDAPCLRRLTYDGRSTPLEWTADGQTLLIQRPGRVVSRQQLSELWALSVDDGREWLVSDNAFYASAQGDQVAYLRFVDQGQWTAMVASLKDGPASQLGAAQWNMPPVWVQDEVVYLRPSLPETRARLSGDGRSVATTDGRILWVEGSGGQIVVARADQVWGFAWSSSGLVSAGNRLAYVVSNGGPQPELWVWHEKTGHASIVARGELEHLGVPVWSPDGRQLAFARHRTGNGPNAAGDIWLVDAAGTGLHPLALTPTDEQAPCWSPDGRTLALALEGDVWLAGLESCDLGAELASVAVPDPSQELRLGWDRLRIAPLSLTAPLTIRVIHDAGNACRNVPIGQIDVYPFEQYVKQVVPHEVPTTWPTETLRTQAVAARTYAWRKIMDRRSNPQNQYDVRDSTADQYLCDETYPSTDLAVEQTEGQHIAYGGNVIYAFFCAEAGTPTNYKNEFDLDRVPYLRPVDDPVSFGRVRQGHSWGMSQWGARRWADQHGWGYQQILCHYYTSATVERAAGITQPLGSLIRPGSDFYVHTDHAYLRANASDDVRPLTVTFAARVTDTWTVVYTDADGSDGWGYVWPVLSYADTATPSIGLRVAVYDGAGQVVTSAASHVGLDRIPSTGTLAISFSTVTTLAVSLNLSATDPSPGSGSPRGSLGNEDWVWEDGTLYKTAGTIVTDSAAGDGSAWHIRAGAKGALFGPCTPILPAGNPYRAYFRLKVPITALTSPMELLELDVATDGGGTLLGVRYLRGTDFKAGDAYQEFAVDFEYPENGGPIELRAEFYGAFDLWLDRVRIVSYPADVSPDTAWTLPAREGRARVTAKYVDGAGNVSADVPLTVTVVDTSPPGGWRQFRCTGWTCTVQVRDAIAGLDVGSAAYRYSADGGISWSDWLSAMCSGANGSHDWETITAANVPLTLPADNAIQFKIRDWAVARNGGQSPGYRRQVWHLYLPIVSKE